LIILAKLRIKGSSVEIKIFRSLPQVITGIGDRELFSGRNHQR
jgi:hypothetical protein